MKVDEFLDNLPAYFDKDSNPILVFEITGVLSVTVDVDARTLTVKETIKEFVLDVDDMTIGDIVMHLLSNGYTGISYSTVYNNLYWFTLVSQLTTGKVYYEGSLLRRFYGVLAQFWKDNVKSYDDALTQAYFYQSREHWLDLWGKYFGYLRKTDEKDDNYFARIMQEILRLKTNNKALMKLVKEVSQYFVDVVDLGTFGQDIFYTNYLQSITNSLGASDTLFDVNTGSAQRNNAFGVYIYAGNINNLSAYEKSIIVDTIEKYRAAGNHPIYFAPIGLLNTNTSGEETNDIGYVVAPEPRGWTEITV